MAGVLVVEDQPNLRRSIANALREDGYTVDAAAGLAEATRLLSAAPDVILLDIMLPDGSGLDWLKSLRHNHSETPVLILTARDSIQDRVSGLDCGADDYLVKPFSIDELKARIRALLRRGAAGSQPDATTVSIQDLHVDLVERRVVRGSRSLELTPRQFNLLVFLMRHCNQTVSREEIAVSVWKQPEATWTNVIEVYINQLRKKLESPDSPPLLHTVRGSGYRLGDPP
ncbi:MAG: response regulator transcription factor [Planctomycetota bacterium]